jgi:plastocyanin
VRLTTSAADLPAGLALLTDYYLIAPDANHLKFATSLVNALAGTAINITDIGTGTHTVTAEALSASTKLQKSVDGVLWVDVHDDEVIGGGNSQTITVTGSSVWNIPQAAFNFVRQVLTMTGGQMSMESVAYSK